MRYTRDLVVWLAATMQTVSGWGDRGTLGLHYIFSWRYESGSGYTGDRGLWGDGLWSLQ
jgi:hypothetical protein